MKRLHCLSIFRVKYWQQLSLIFIITFLLTVVPASPSYTRPTSQEQSNIIEGIENTAKLDYETESIDVKNVIKTYKDAAEKLGLTEKEIREIYQQKIVELKNDKPDTDNPDTDNPWKDLQPFGFLFGLGVLFWNHFNNAINNKFAQMSQGLINFFFKRCSGIKLFRNLALQRYRKALRTKHQELKIPFRPNRPLQMTEVYVPLQLLEQGEPLDSKQVFHNFKRLMIVGQPGSGKTMLLKSLVLNYANGLWDIPQQPVAIILELNRLSDTKLTIEQHLAKALERDDFPNGENFVLQGLKQGMIMLLFDGLDEVNGKDRPNVICLLQDFVVKYDQCRVAITCRTQVYKREFDAQVDQTVEVVDFNDQQIRKFLRPWKPSMSVEKSVDQLVQTLRDRPQIMELARNPLMLTIMAYLYTDTPFVLPHSRAEFYEKATDILLEAWDQARQTRNYYKGRDKKLVLRHLALFGLDQTRRQQQDRRHLSWLDVYEEVRSILPGLNLRAESDVEPILEEICERSGLLMLIDGDEAYRFTHLTLQEFFAATQLINDVEGLIKRFSEDPDAWRETAKLWCGLSGDSSTLIQAIDDKDRVTAFSCLADAQNVEPTLATEIIEYFKGCLLGSLSVQSNTSLNMVSSDSAIKAFGMVGADQRPRGQDVLTFLAQTLVEQKENSTSVVFAAQVQNDLIFGSCLTHSSAPD